MKCVLPDRAEKLAGSDPDYNNRMLYNAIANGNPVSKMRYFVAISRSSKTIMYLSHVQCTV